jgi:hypothetical protein
MLRTFPLCLKVEMLATWGLMIAERQRLPLVNDVCWVGHSLVVKAYRSILLDLSNKLLELALKIETFGFISGEVLVYEGNRDSSISTSKLSYHQSLYGRSRTSYYSTNYLTKLNFEQICTDSSHNHNRGNIIGRHKVVAYVPMPDPRLSLLPKSHTYNLVPYPWVYLLANV